MSWGTIDDAQFQQFANKIKNKIDSGMIKQEIEMTAFKVGVQAGKNVRSMTPVKEGNLRRQWSIVGPTYTGNAFVIELQNNTEYASYVEDGHRQTPGRYVPTIGKRLKASWVPGTHMLMKTMFEIDAQMPQLLSPILRDLGGLFD
ncbi:HK97 gp10 family phage protein [Companilactobacillus musae]|uniref:HK97 gp10 family phage protein n=1 Tax=Companilactobacillus musae TaxID=1903258 RepID=UPI000E64600F|nr:HK97 gp10 family phage protein [Companilactobacillus musae]